MSSSSTAGSFKYILLSVLILIGAFVMGFHSFYNFGGEEAAELEEASKQHFEASAAAEKCSVAKAELEATIRDQAEKCSTSKTELEAAIKDQAEARLHHFFGKNGYLRSFDVHYHGTDTDLSTIGAKYDSEKSSQSDNVSSNRFAHPYTLFYHPYFKKRRYSSVDIAEVGNTASPSLLMWNEYFQHENTTITGFHRNSINKSDFFSANGDTHSRIKLIDIDISTPETLQKCFMESGRLFDVIMDDSSNNVDDRVRIVKTLHQFLKPGGAIVIENIHKDTNEHEYWGGVGSDLYQHFQDFFFLTMTLWHGAELRSTGKLFVLIKKGPEVFGNYKKVTVITPAIRTQGLIAAYDTMNFNLIHKWIIVYDGRHVAANPRLFRNNPKVEEHLFVGDGRTGNPQRNFALDTLNDTDSYLHFLDDDNIVHPTLFRFLRFADDHRIFTFNQKDRLPGSNVVIGQIDTAMVLQDLTFTKRWNTELDTSDGIYISEIRNENEDKWVWINNDLSFYNHERYGQT